MNSLEKAEKKYYGKNYDFVVNERKILDKKFKENFLKKYPYADMSKFYFEHDINKDGSWEKTITYFKNNPTISTDINSDTFKNYPNMTKYLYINKPKPHFPKIWKLGGTVQELPKGRRHVDYSGKHYYFDNFPTQYVLSYPINQFRIYVNNTDYFQSNLPKLNITTNDNAKFSLSESYFQSIIGTWIATYGCGISIQHLLFSSNSGSTEGLSSEAAALTGGNVPKQITSFMRFHLYFTVRRIMWQLRNGDDKTFYKFNAGFLKDHYPKWTYQEIMKIKNEHLGQDTVGVDKWKRYQHGPGQIRDTQNDYKKFVPTISDGLTKNGTELLNQSIEAYLYAILGAQARTRQSIVSNRASALETQKVFRQIFEDSIINYDTSTWINNMNQAISSTNVVLNTAISPTLWLIPSSLIILKNPIEGYNNKLKVSDENMVFGINENLNHVATPSGYGEVKKLNGNSIKSNEIKKKVSETNTKVNKKVGETNVKVN